MNKTILVLIGISCALITVAGIINSRPRPHSVALKSPGYQITAPLTELHKSVPFQAMLGPGADSWAPDGAGRPFVLKEDGTYKMWYTANNYSPVSSYWCNNASIGYAESPDGVNWTNQQIVHARDNASTEHLLAAGPWIIKDDGIYRMWHTDYYKWVGGDWSTYISLLVSIDGINWAREKEALIGSGDLSDYDDYATQGPSVIMEPDGTYLMWYSVDQRPKVGSLGPSNIARATSANGTAWTNKQLALARIPGTAQASVASPDVIRNSDGTYTMYYANLSSSKNSIYRAVSPDGINWTDRQLLLTKGQLDSDILSIGSPYYFKDADNTEYLYFSFTRPSARKLGFKEYIARARLDDITSRLPLPDVDEPETAAPETDVIMGKLGYSLGTYLTIEGTLAGEAKPGSRFIVDTLNGQKLTPPIDIDIRDYKKWGLAEDRRYILKGYESGEMLGVPNDAASIENLPPEQPVWQFYKYFIITSIFEQKH